MTGGEDAALIDAQGDRQNPKIAVLTNYAVGRVKRDFRDGQSSVGVSATAVDRALGDTPLAATLHDQAYTAGTQLDHRWDHNVWEAKLEAVGSWVHGTPDAIANTQQQSLHRFQRPDAKDAHFDPMRTSLAGFGGDWKVGPMGETKHWRAFLGGQVRTPGLELNDAGFQVQSDLFVPFVLAQYHDEDPGDTVLNWNLTSDVFTMSNFDPILVNYGYEGNANVQFANYWSWNAGLNAQGGGRDPVALRGGPALRTDQNVNPFMAISTDNRKRVQFSLAGWAFRDWKADAMAGGIDASATIQARSNLDLAIGPSWSRRDDPMQYIAEATDQAGNDHYVTGHINFTSASLTLRLNWTFSPHLSLQAYAQPFIASGAYDQLKDVDNPHAAQFADRFHPLSRSEARETSDTVFVNYNGTYSFDRPDFNFQQLRSTVVLRWEYRPGSNVFAIWSHGQTNSISDGRFDLGS